MDSGLVVVGISRSGTSMVTGCLVAAGAWCGECREADERNPRGCFENLTWHRHLHLGGGNAWQAFDCSRPAGKPWVLKVGLEWEPTIPLDIPRVVVRRPTRAIIASRKRAGFTRLGAREIEHYQSRLSWIEKDASRIAWSVRADKIAARDFFELVPALRHLAVAENEKTLRPMFDFVDRSLWHSE